MKKILLLLNKINLLRNIKCILVIFIAIFGLLSLSAFFSTSIWLRLGFENFGLFLNSNITLLVNITGTLGIIITFVSSSLENRKNVDVTNFFKIVDYHTENVRSLNISEIGRTKKVEGRRAFVIFKQQIMELLKIVNDINSDLVEEFSNKEIADLVYTCFYYGINKKWVIFSRKHFSKFEKDDNSNFINKLEQKVEECQLKVGRTNLTSVSNYYNNFYQAIKFIDESKYLSQKDKYKYIEILTSQLSSPELYVLYFYLNSSFGIKCRNYTEKYQLLKNLPLNYINYINSKGVLKEYNPKEFFPKLIFEDEV